MHNRFTLEIRLGNDAMQTPSDVARALSDISHQLEAESSWDDAEAIKKRLTDINGNTVGWWELDEPQYSSVVECPHCGDEVDVREARGL